MTISFQQLITDCLVALGDSGGATWSRLNKMQPWCIEAIRTFPILRPMRDDHTFLVGALSSFDLATDFREVISVEYPISQTPPAYLVRKNRMDSNFYNDAGYYDIDHNYTTGSGWVIYLSAAGKIGEHIYIQYLANHDTDMVDDPNHFISIPDEYEGIFIAQIMCRAYRERLSFAMQDPTAHSNVVYQLTQMVDKMEKSYREQVLAAQNKLVSSVISPPQRVDKYDRVY